ncbi:Acetyltransferase (GNAT) domain-containing protein [Gracilibacillus ureilyticus]|uniref:Acetyltransferase (GNAT) domain-containing protein n=1 Tax=Gracilibacillus ureilyticus TaxID=531814 RepID=A0A1H9Q4R1_9BACI|nr:GNAT family N-acetyltransferase [Gracilibacillus ureilyticus]SER55105.1 Acetyltransferase (GNAT) domain-containing protein [Gracilibacillus ureilyticus]
MINSVSEQIKELVTKEEWIEAFPVMKQLRTHLDKDLFIKIVQEAKELHDYRLIGLYSNNEIIALSGFMPMTTLYNGKFIWVCDLVTESQKQSMGYGRKLLSYIENWATQHDYGIVSLSSGLLRENAHRFYEDKMSYRKVSYVFLKELK